MNSNLLTALNKTEASNGMLICSIARANAILADGNRTVLQANLGLIDRAIRSNPEMGYMTNSAIIYDISLK